MLVSGQFHAHAANLPRKERLVINLVTITCFGYPGSSQ